MKKLKTILQSRYLFKIIVVFALIYAFLISFYFPVKSKYQGTEKSVVGIITKFQIDGNHLLLEVKGKEKVIVNYYFTKEKEKNYYLKKLQLGMTLMAKGEMELPSRNTIPNLFDYQEYLKIKKIFYLMNADQLEILKNNTSIFFELKNQLIKRIDHIDDTGYFRTFILGDKTFMKEETIFQYQRNGVSHLFSISGMHVSFIVGFLLFFLNKLTYDNKIKYFVLCCFLIFYLYLTNCSASIMRTTVMFILFSCNKCFNLKIKPFDLMLLTLTVIIIINPLLLQDVGFQFSYLVSTSLVLSRKKISGFRKKWQQSLYISYISFLVSYPISIYHFQGINILSILFNLIMVPIVSLIIFPLTFLILFLPGLYPIYRMLIQVLEWINLFFYQIKYLNFIFAKPSIIIILIYYVFILLSIFQKRYLLVLVFLLVIHKLYPYWNNTFIMNVLDVGQGDAIFIKLPNNKGNILIDTGGAIERKKEKWEERSKETSIALDKIIPYLNTLGITSLDYLILTHGDYDHMGEAKNLIENFKVDKVIFNCGEFNELEKDLIKVLDKKHIKYYSCITSLNINNNKLYFLNTKEYNDENENSSVIYTKIDNTKMLFMGDAGKKREKDILEKYNLKNIDFLKVGHHGSNTSSSKEFIDGINPKYSLISVGKNNRYGHPKKSVLDTLKESKMYRTDIDGSIMFKIKNNKLIIETCVS